MDKKELPEELRLRRMLNALQEVAEEYPGSRTLTNIIQNIESRIKFYEKTR